jgi:hypothetical protein
VLYRSVPTDRDKTPLILYAIMSDANEQTTAAKATRQFQIQFRTSECGHHKLTSHKEIVSKVQSCVVPRATTDHGSRTRKNVIVSGDECPLHYFKHWSSPWRKSLLRSNLLLSCDSRSAYLRPLATISRLALNLLGGGSRKSWSGLHIRPI